MALHERAARTLNSKALEVNLRYAEKLSRLTVDLIEARENRRSPKKVMVGTVKVEAGGQAIVGNIDSQNEGCSSGDADPGFTEEHKVSRGRRR